MTLTVNCISSNKTLTKYCVDGTAFYRPNSKKIKYFDFKLFTEANNWRSTKFWGSYDSIIK
jgi:antirestriction protein ArdC